jgi:hypothetical protein
VRSTVSRREFLRPKIPFLSLPEMGIAGNTHLLMLDKNNREIADIIMECRQTHTGA